MKDAVERKPGVIRLGNKFHRRIDVADRPGRVRAATRNGIDTGAVTPPPVGFGLHDGVHVAAAGVDLGCRAVQMVEQDIAVAVVVRIIRSGAVLEKDMAFHAEFCRRGGCLAGVI